MVPSSPNPHGDSPRTFSPGTHVAVLVPAPMPGPLTYVVGEGQTVVEGSIVKVPLGTRKVLGTVWGAAEPGGKTNRLKAIVEVMDAPPLRAPLRGFVDWVADWTLAAPGMVARMITRGKDLMVREPPVAAVRRSGAEPSKLTEARRRVLAVMTGADAYTRTGLADLAGVSVAVIDGLVRAGALQKVLLEREPGRIMPDPDFDPRTLTRGQADAVDALIAPPADAPAVALLEGVTGSGKTEVYFEVIAATLRQGRQAITSK